MIYQTKQALKKIKDSMEEEDNLPVSFLEADSFKVLAPNYD